MLGKIVGLLTLGAFVRSKRPGVMTAERDKIYRAAISGSLKDPAKLRKLADAFEKARLFPQAQLLRQRAALRELPTDVKKARRDVFRRAMHSTNKDAMLKVADVFESEGCTSAAGKIRTAALALPPIAPNGESVITPQPASDAPTEMPTESPVETPSSAEHESGNERAAAE